MRRASPLVSQSVQTKPMPLLILVFRLEVPKASIVLDSKVLGPSVQSIPELQQRPKPLEFLRASDLPQPRNPLRSTAMRAKRTFPPLRRTTPRHCLPKSSPHRKPLPAPKVWWLQFRSQSNPFLPQCLRKKTLRSLTPPLLPLLSLLKPSESWKPPKTWFLLGLSSTQPGLPLLYSGPSLPNAK